MNKDNQQEILTKELEIAWLAGMLNGDGCFSLQARKRPGKKSVNVDLSITLTQTDATIIEKAFNIISGLIDGTPRIVEATPLSKGGQTIIHLRISRMSYIHVLLKAILPHLVGNKAARARMILKYVSHRLSLMDVAVKNKNPLADSKSMEMVKNYYFQENKTLPPEVQEILRD